MTTYNPDVYWSRVAQEIEKRGENFIAGDDNPYYRYKRGKFLQEFLDKIDFQSKGVLEVGFGPGGNLHHIITKHEPKKLCGVDVSQKMFELATNNLRSYINIKLDKIDGATIPYPDNYFDICFTVTVLQHNTDEILFRKLVNEMCRVTKSEIVLMEDIALNREICRDGSWIGRKVDDYQKEFSGYGYKMTEIEFLNTKISRRWYQRVSNLGRRFSTKCQQEGDRIGGAQKFFMALPMPITRILDKVFVEEQNLAKMVFHRQ